MTCWLDPCMAGKRNLRSLHLKRMVPLIVPPEQARVCVWGPLGYAWIWKWLTICIYYQTLTLLNHPFGGPMIHIHLYIHPTSHPNHSLEHIRRWVPWRMTCHLCASWGLGCCFLRIPVSDPHMRTLESKFRYPMIFGGYKLGWHHNRNSTARSRFPKQFPTCSVNAMVRFMRFCMSGAGPWSLWEQLRVWMARPQKKTISIWRLASRTS